MRILIVNVWSDLNRGDSAILLGMVYLLKKHFSSHLNHSKETLHIAIMSEFDEDDPNYDSGYTIIKKYYPQIEIVPALFPYPLGRRFLRIVKWMGILGRGVAVLIFPFLGEVVFRGKKARSWRELKKSNLVISKGGHIFHCATPTIAGLLGILKHSYPLILGKRLKKKTVLYAQSYGPFSGRINQFFLKWFFNNVDGISAREKESIRILNSLKVKRTVSLVPDSAFLLEPPEKGGTSDNLIMITPRCWHLFGKNVFENYIQSLSDVVYWIVQDLRYEVGILPHTLGPSGEENDRIAAKELYERIKRKEERKGVKLVLQRCRIIDTTSFDAIQLLKFYSNARVLIGTRFHSVIFALLNKVPVLAISYFGPKAKGIMEELGLDDFVIDIRNINAYQLKRKIEYILNHERDIREYLEIKIPEFQNQAKNRGLLFLNRWLC